MLSNAYFLAKIGADTAENEQQFAKILPIGRRVADRHAVLAGQRSRPPPGAGRGARLRRGRPRPRGAQRRRDGYCVRFGLKMREAVIRQGMAHGVSMTQSRDNAGRQLYFSILVTTCADA